MIRVLVADDDAMITRLHSALVDRVPGFTVAGVTHSGQETLRAVRDLAPDLVLLDLYLPDLHGLDVLRELRGGGAPGEGPDVLVVTASRDIGAVRGAQRGGAVQYLIKPFEGALLQERLRSWARERRELASLTAAGQDDVDRLFGVGTHTPLQEQTDKEELTGFSRSESTPSGAPSLYPKGLTPQTAALVRRTLEAAPEGEGLSASECAAYSGLSRASSRRYLEYFTNTGRAGVTLRYGTAGRPERRYHPAPGSRESSGSGDRKSTP